MGRPALEVGTAGKTRYRTLEDGRVQARCLYRDLDGHSRPVARIGKTQTAADRQLAAALRDRKRVSGDVTISSDMRLTELAELFLGRLDASDKAIGTKQQYRKIWLSPLQPLVGQLRVREATVGACDRALTAITDVHGPSVAKTSRAVLSSMLGLAARHDAISHNPVRDTDAIAGGATPKKGRPRRLTPEDEDRLADGLRTLPMATYEERDLADLVDLALGTAARIGELLACREGVNGDGEPLLDLTAGTWEVNATLIRVGGVQRRRALEKKAAAGSLTWEEQEELDATLRYGLEPGLHVQERTKSDAGWRILALPPFCVDMLRDRQTRPRLVPPDRVVFGSPGRRALRDPSNTARDLRIAVAALGFDDWAPTFHTFRKTALSKMEDAGFTAREAADQAGHSKPSMTQDVYFGRTVTVAKAAETLNR